MNDNNGVTNKTDHPWYKQYNGNGLPHGFLNKNERLFLLLTFALNQKKSMSKHLRI